MTPIVRGRQTVTRGPGNDGGKIECKYLCYFFKIPISVCEVQVKDTKKYLYFQEKNTALYRPALEELRRQIRSSTTSMTSVPKPLKFLRPHYGKLKEIYEGMAPGENKVCYHSPLGMKYILTLFRCLNRVKLDYVTFAF